MLSGHRQCLGTSPANPSGSIFHGNTVVTGGTFIHQAFGHNAKGGFDLLREASAPAAFHDSEQRADPPKCHPNTRVAVLRRITEWVLGTDINDAERRAFMLWLYGAAGSGKTAIAQTIAEQSDDEGILLGGFFFSRGDPTRNHAGHLVATIAYQIALKIPEVKDSIVAAVEHDPLIFSKSLEVQFMRLIFEPIECFKQSNSQNLQPKYLIILDGLDECVDQSARCKILQVLMTMTACRQHPLPPSLLFLIASRPELDIQTIINSQSADTSLNRLALDKDYSSDQDIRVFLQEKFNELKHHHPHRAYIPSKWPSDSTIGQLVKSSSGQFIFASTVVKFVSSVAHKPTHRLDIILGLRPTRSDAPFAALDELYTHIFSTAHDLDLVLRVLGLAILGRSRECWMLEKILGLEKGDVEVLFSTLGSIVAVESGIMRPIKILHASIEDYLFDELRSKNLCIRPAERHAEYAHLLFPHLVRDRLYLGLGGYVAMFIRHLSMALPTAELREDITQPSMDTVYHKYLLATPQQGSMFLSYFRRFVNPFLSCIKALPWDDAARLYEIQRENFDQILRQKLGAYYTHHGLTFAVAVISLTELYLSQETIFCLQRNHRGLFDDSARYIDDRELAILAPDDTYGDYDDYYPYLSQFLADSSRCRQYALTTGKYAKAALYLYQSIYSSALEHNYEISKFLDVLVLLFDRAGKSPSLLDEIAHRQADFMTAVIEGLEVEALPVKRSKEWYDRKIKFAEDIVANYVRRTTGQ